MKNILLTLLALAVTFFSEAIVAQNKESKKIDQYHFDEKAAREQAKAKGIRATDIEGYVQFLKNDFASKKALSKQAHKHSPYEQAGTPGIQETVIYLEPNKPMSLGCPNMGFEQYNFNGWTGGIGTVAMGPTGGNPIYTSTGGTIVNTAGNNVPPSNTVNYHTIMSLPPVQPNIASPANGYDENACKAVGSQTISQIPYVSPFSFDPVSVRMNGTNSNYRACRLKYITTSSSTNQRLSFSYAVVLQDPAGHAVEESPYFKVEVRNEGTGAILPGCTSYTFNPKSALPSDSLMQSNVGSTFDPTFYRKWQYYSVDLSTLPSGTSVSINFEVGGCTASGHWGYAYVDAECGGIGVPYGNMCSGSNFATLVAPTGFTTYQWYGPGGIIVGANNDTLIQTPATPGTTYSVNMVSPGGCIITQTVSVGFTTVNIINLNATSSCAGGNSGTASVQASGSNGIYTYSWTNTGTGAPAGTSQTATGLAPGTYSVLVSSTTCGQASANLSVGVSPPFFLSQIKPFCGNSTSIPLPGGNSYTWYHNNTLIPAPIGINDTLYITSALAGDMYTAVYNNPQGCRDSIQYTLDLVAGGSSYFSNTTNVCPSDSNGTTVINLNTPFSAPYSYLVTGPTPSNIVTNTTNSSATSLTLTTLAPGTYTAVIYDGLCIYNNTVTVGVIATNFTITPTNTVLCFPEEVTLNFDFGDVAPASCGLSSTGSCATPNVIQIGTGTAANSNTSYPAIYGNFYRNTRHQILYRASELLAAGVQAGKLSSIAFNISTIDGTTTYPDFTIKIKCTPANDLAAGSNFDNTGLVQVFYAPSININSGWNTYTFANAYEWDGVSNILIDVCNSITNPSYTYNSSTPYTITSFNSVRWFNSDGTPACGNPTSNGYTPNTTYRPNIRFGNCGASAPSAYTVAVSSNGTITTNYANDSLKVAPSAAVPPAGGNITYTITVTNPIGACTATQVVTVLYPPITTTVLASGSTTLCEGSTTTLLANGAFNYNWYYQQGAGGPFQPIATSQNISVTPPAVGTNTYMVIGSSPCPSSIDDSSFVTVNVIPKANLIVTPLVDVTKCLNKEFAFNASANSTTPNSPGTPLVYSWTTLPGNLPAPGVNSTNTYTTNSNTTTTLVVTVTGSCAIPTSDTVVVKNFVDDLGIAISNSLTTCPNKPFALTSTVTGGHAIYNYTWTVNGSQASTTPNLNYTSPPSGGMYTVGVTVIDSCAYQKFDTEVIYVLPNTLNVAIIDSVSLCGNTPFSLNSTMNGGYPDYTYQWFLLPDNNSYSNTSGLSYTTPQAEGVYTVQVVITDSCGYQQSDYQLINVLPPCQIEIPNVITPNGDLANDFFRIKNIEYHPNTLVTIFDRWGLKVFESTNYNNEWKGDGLNDGTFFYIIEVPDDKKYSGFVTVFRK
ncbi:MAG: gliding motility-associated C-terminal domain-containing protein [Bacteroidota bacterium]